MKKIIALLLLISMPVPAATTGTLVLSGTVAVINSLTVNLVSGATNLNITGGETNKLVAIVSEQSNSPVGYKIQIKSDNGSELRLVGDNTKKTTYTVSYDGSSPITPTTSYQDIKNVNILTALTTHNSELRVNVAAYESAPAGNYTDTITFQIVAN